MEPHYLTYLSALAVGVGGVLMFVAARNTDRLIKALHVDLERDQWKLLKSFMEFFLLGYAVTAGVILSERTESLVLVVGTVFLVGSLFVLKTVQTGQKSISQLDDAVRAKTAELERSRHQAEDAMESRTRFMANVSHEIRTPMNAVIGLTTLLLQSDLSPKQREDLLTLRESGDVLLRVVTDVLDFAKMETDSFQLESEPISMDGIIETALKVWSPPAGEKGVEVRYERSNGWWPYWLGDKIRLQQILHNLLANAVRFTDRGEIVVAVDCGPALIKMEVRDTGSGIAKNDLEQIFHSFRQSATDRGGTGLGLAICHRLVEAMAGSIKVESEPGEGSCFLLSLPLQRWEEPPPSAEVDNTTPLEQSAHVLLVDDNEVNLKVARRYLERLGCRVTTATDGRQAVELAGDEDFDLILMDCQMPVMTGMEATERIRRLENHESPRIFALTAMATPEEKEACLKAGMDGVITKPVRLAELRRVLTENQSS